MKNNEAIELIKKHVTLKTNDILKAEKIKDFDNYWYVSCHKDGESVGVHGYDYVINIENKIIYAVPASMPPHFNLRSATSGDAIELKDLTSHQQK